MQADTPEAVPVASWEDMAERAANAAIRWNTRHSERWGEGEGPTKNAEIGFGAQMIEKAAHGNANLSIHAPEGRMEFSLGVQVHFADVLAVEPPVLADFVRNVLGPMLVSYLRAVVTSESQVMGWDDLILPPTVERVLRDMTDEQLLGTWDSE